MRQALGYDMTFQSTLPRRERPETFGITKRVHNFNPRSREGSDAYNHAYYGCVDISIHAPAKGATEDFL